MTNPNDNVLKTDVNIAELIAFLQGIDLENTELDELVTSLTTYGLTETTKRKVRTVLMRVVNQDLTDLERYEQALDIVRERDAAIDAIVHEGEQSLNRIDMQMKAELDKVERKVSEDTDAAKGGATLLLHTEDVAPTDVELPAISPKEASAAVIDAAKTPVPASISPIAKSEIELPVDDAVSATQAPLPPTSVAPPAVTEPGA